MIAPEYDMDGNKIGYISIRQDVTAEVEFQKLTDELEEIVRNRTEELSVLNEQNEAIFESATIGILLLRDRKVIKANAAICEMLGRTQEELIGSKTRDWYVNEEDYLDVGRKYELVKRGETVFWEHQFRKKGNGIFWVRVRMKAIGAYSSEKTVVATLEDVTLEKLRFFEIEQARKAAEEATRTKSAFLANMSHEIRTPMNAIIGMTHLAMSGATEPKQKNYLQKIDIAAKNLLGIINDILDFSKIESGKMSFEEIPFSLEDVFDNVSNVNMLKIKNKGLEFIFSMDASLPTKLIGDPLRLEQILTNLVSNAVKFTDKGEVKVGVRLAQRDGDFCVLEFDVTDTGIGLKKEQISNLFKAFSQADASTTREYGGTGLGLTICKYLVERMDGTIWVESEHGKGSSFFFRVRLKLQENQNTPVAAVQKGTPPKVLVVDDNDAAREILEGMLRSLKFEVFTSSSGAEAIEILYEAQKASEPFELVIIDWMMPGLDGVDTIKIIKNDPYFKRLPTFIMVTAYDRDELLKKAEDVHIDGVIAKPVTPSTLFDTIINASKIIKAPSKEEEFGDSHNTIAENLKGAKILLVEDNALNQEFAVDLLEEYGMSVDIANNGKEAVEMANAKEYDGILMDCQMPVMDGYEATRQIRAEGRYKSVPILALSANAMEGDRRVSLESGMNDHIPKPIDIKNLFETMAKWISPKNIEIAACGTQETKLQKGNEKYPDIKGLDIGGALARTANNSPLLTKMLKRFSQTQGEWIDKIDLLLLEEKIEDARRETHTLKGLAANIGATNLFGLTQEIESHLKEGRVGFATDLIARAKDELREVIGNISEFFAAQSAEPCVAVQTSGQECRAELKVDIERLISLLDESDAQATELAQKVGLGLAKLGLGSEAKELEELVEAFEFESAKELLLRCKI